MATFEEVVNGDIVPHDNPFYHRNIRKESDTEWIRGGKSLKMSEIAYDVNAKGPTLELIVKAGHYARVQIKSRNSGFFGDTDDYTRGSWNLKAFDNGINNSFLIVTLYGGAAIAVSTERLSLSDSFKTHLRTDEAGIPGDDVGVVLAAAPKPMGPGENVGDGRRFEWDEMDESCVVSLVSWGRDTSAGKAVTEQTTSRDSMGIEEFLAQFPDQGESSEDSIFSIWTMERIVEAHADSQGFLYDISIGWTNPMGPYFIMVNGIDAGQENTFGEAKEEVSRLDAEWRTGNLPLIYRREVVEEEEPNEIDWNWKPDWWPSWFEVGGVGLIIVGVVIAGVVVFFMARQVGKNAAAKVIS